MGCNNMSIGLSGACVVSVIAGLALYIGAAVSAGRIKIDFAIENKNDFTITLGNSNCKYNLYSKDCDVNKDVFVTPPADDQDVPQPVQAYGCIGNPDYASGANGAVDLCRVMSGSEACEESFTVDDRDSENKDFKGLKWYGYIQTMKVNKTTAAGSEIKSVTGTYTVRSPDMALYVLDECKEWDETARNLAGALVFWVLGSILVCCGCVCGCVAVSFLAKGSD